MNGEAFTIGTLAKRAGVNVQTVRYYERIGLLPQPERPQGGYRRYTGDTVARLHFIRHAASLGFTLAETRELLELRARRGTPCKTVRTRAEQKLVTIEQKLADLLELRDAVARLVQACSGNTAVDHCSILAVLDEPQAKKKGNK